MFFFCSISNWYKLNVDGAMLGQSTTLFLNHDSGCILLEQYGTQFSLNFNYHYLFQFFKAKCRQLMYSISNEYSYVSQFSKLLFVSSWCHNWYRFPVCTIAGEQTKLYVNNITCCCFTYCLIIEIQYHLLHSFVSL